MSSTFSIPFAESTSFFFGVEMKHFFVDQSFVFSSKIIEAIFELVSVLPKKTDRAKKRRLKKLSREIK